MASLPLQHELTAYSGATFHQEFQWLPDGTTPQDLTLWHAGMRIGYPTTMIVELTDDNGGIALDVDGSVIITLLPAETALLAPQVYSYHLDLTDPVGNVIRLLRGRFEVIRDVDAT